MVTYDNIHCSFFKYIDEKTFSFFQYPVKLILYIFRHSELFNLEETNGACINEGLHGDE